MDSLPGKKKGQFGKICPMITMRRLTDNLYLLTVYVSNSYADEAIDLLPCAIVSSYYRLFRPFSVLRVFVRGDCLQNVLAGENIRPLYLYRCRDNCIGGRT
jgi:hypothetical protein